MSLFRAHSGGSKGSLYFVVKLSAVTGQVGLRAAMWNSPMKRLDRPVGLAGRITPALHIAPHPEVRIIRIGPFDPRSVDHHDRRAAFIQTSKGRA